jgi:hypothetical protein
MPTNFKKSPSNFTKIKLYLNHFSDNLMKPPQTYITAIYLSHPVRQFDDIFVDLGNFMIINAQSMHISQS